MKSTRKRIVTLLTLLAFVGQLISVAAMGLDFQSSEAQMKMPACHSEADEKSADGCCDGNCAMMLCHSPVITTALFIPSPGSARIYNAHDPSREITQRPVSLYRPPISSQAG